MGGHGWTGGGLTGSGTTLCSRCAAPAECGREAGLERRRAVHHCTDGKTEAPGRRGPQGLRNQRPARNWPSVPRPALLPSLWWPLHPLGSRITLSTVEALFMSLENRAELGPERVWQASFLGFADGSHGKEPTCSAGGTGDGARSLVRKLPWRREWHPLQDTCLGNPVDRGAWQAAVHGAAKSRTRLSIQNLIYTQASCLEWRLMQEVWEAGHRQLLPGS